MFQNSFFNSTDISILNKYGQYVIHYSCDSLLSKTWHLLEKLYMHHWQMSKV